jgi:hypothetical protein
MHAAKGDKKIFAFVSAYPSASASDWVVQLLS